MKKFMFLLSIVTILFAGCEDDSSSGGGDTPTPPPSSSPMTVVDVSAETEWDYWAVSSTDYYYVNTENTADATIITNVLFHSEEAGTDYSIFFTLNGMLDKVVFEDFIIIFRNFDGELADIGIIFPNGDIEILRQVPTGYNWGSFAAKTTNSTESLNEIIVLCGEIISGVPCSLTAAASVSTTGGLELFAQWSCGNSILEMSVSYIESETNYQSNITEFEYEYGISETSIYCEDLPPMECAIGAAIAALYELSIHISDLENNVENIVSAEGALNYGYGDVQITLTWDNEADLDLHVIDPLGEEIYYANPTSTSGGELDVDDTDGFGPENVYWAQGTAPSGVYEVYVHHFPWSEKPVTSNFTVLISAFNITESFYGSTVDDETVYVTSFSNEKIISNQTSGSYKISTPPKK